MKADGPPGWERFHLKSCSIDSLPLSQRHVCLTCVSDTSKQERPWVRGPNTHRTPIFAYEAARFVPPHAPASCTQTCGERKKSCCLAKLTFVVWGQLRCTGAARVRAWEKAAKAQTKKKLDAALRRNNGERGPAEVSDTMRWNRQRGRLQSELTMGTRFIFNLSHQRNDGSGVSDSPGGGKVMEITSHSFYFCSAAK